MLGVIGKKIGMSQIIDDQARSIPVTYLAIQPNYIIQIKTNDNDGYNAIVIGSEKLTKPAKTKKYRYLKEFKVIDPSIYNVGDEVDLNKLKEIKTVAIKGITKGKGFQGVIKRYNFAGGPKSHGSHFHRAPGSVGACDQPGEVHKGKKLPGQMGSNNITLKNRKILLFNEHKSVLGIKGAIPGSKDSIIIITFNS